MHYQEEVKRRQIAERSANEAAREASKLKDKLASLESQTAMALSMKDAVTMMRMDPKERQVVSRMSQAMGIDATVLKVCVRARACARMCVRACVTSVTMCEIDLHTHTKNRQRLVFPYTRRCSRAYSSHLRTHSLYRMFAYYSPILLMKEWEDAESLQNVRVIADAPSARIRHSYRQNFNF